MEITQNKKQVKFSVAIKSDVYKKMIVETLGNPRVAQNFVADITTVVSLNPRLQECDAGSIISAGLVAQRIGLPLSQALGYAYVVPYKCKEEDANGKTIWVDKAQFQMGYKGYIQLCLRTGQYQKIGVKPVHEGELQGLDEFGDEIIKFDHKYDDAEVIGYYAYFKLLNGAVMTSYKTKKQCEEHGQKYSKSYKGLWTTNFDTMAMKTVLKLLLSKFGIMSTELRTAIQYDQAIIDRQGDKEILDYVDNPQSYKTIEKDTGEVIESEPEPIDEQSPEMLATADLREQLANKNH